MHDTFGNVIPDLSNGGTTDLGEIDRNWTQSRSLGASAQAVDTDKLAGHDNTLTVGASLDYGWTRFNGNSQLGTIFNDNNTSFPVIGFPFIIDEPDSFLNPVMVHANNTYTGVYALDTYSATDRLTVTAGGRFNYAGIDLEGANGALLNGFSNFFHVNPTLGFTYKLTPDINFYAGYAMTNRTPTPLELGCADPNNPCIIDNFLVSDPKLKQVVGQTFEVGFRGQNALSQLGLGPEWGKLQWSAGLFRTTLNNDILPQQSAVTGFGFFSNVGTTLRQGAEVSAQWTGDKWSAYANYTYIDAIYLTTFQESSPFNPLADANGFIPITNGMPIAGIPKNTVKVGVDYALTDKWHVGADMVAASGQVLFGNENGALPQAPARAADGLGLKPRHYWWSEEGPMSREAAQAYIKSQAHECWKLIRDHYDDGGFSDGSLERPGLQKLLADLRERRIDIVVVYKVDRLTRSLTDFAKLVEQFDSHAVAFVSVTQSFNTTTSMGRLTLNVLLSFAQFEREVTGERIRDKIAASKKKGLWVGGVVPMGYQVKDRKLIVNEEEAATVRLIFTRYLDLGSLPALQRDLRERGIISRTRTLCSGRAIGGRALTNGPLAYMLRNRMYLGEINHRDKSYPGEHLPIIDEKLFEAVRAKLTGNLRGRRLRRQSSNALLLGKLFDDRGDPMTPTSPSRRECGIAITPLASSPRVGRKTPDRSRGSQLRPSSELSSTPSALCRRRSKSSFDRVRHRPKC